MAIGARVTEKEHETALVLANVGDLVAGLIRAIAGNDISSGMNGSSITREQIANIAVNRLADKLTTPAA